MVAGRIALFMLVTGATSAAAWETSAPGSWVGLEVEVGGRTAPLYTSAGGNKYYVEARKGRDYALRLVNRRGERVAVELTVDGLNVISGERNKPGADRMYVLGPYESTEIRGWRTSLEEVRQFTFVDEQASYATRAGKANGKMGWIEMAVYRERDRPQPYIEKRHTRPYNGAEEPSAPAWEGESDTQRSRETAEELAESARDEAASSAKARRGAGAAPAPSFPGTGWGDRMQDSVRLVEFNAERTPIETLTVRYEYRSALYALGVLPNPRSRLDQRERGEYGFAQPPRW